MDAAGFNKSTKDTQSDASHEQQRKTRQQQLAENVFPNLITGNGMDSQPLIDAYEKRKERPKWLRPWDQLNGELIPTDSLVRQMREIAKKYEQVLSEFAKNSLTRVTSDSLIRSEKDLETLTNEILNHVKNNAQYAEDKSLTSKARKQGFSMLKDEANTLQYLAWRLEHPDRLRKGQGALDVSGVLVKEALQNFGNFEKSIEASNAKKDIPLPDYNNFVIIKLAVIESKNRIQDYKSYFIKHKLHKCLREVDGDFVDCLASSTNYLILINSYIPSIGANRAYSRERIIDVFKDFIIKSKKIFVVQEKAENYYLEYNMVEVGREDCKRREEGKPIKERNVIRLKWIDSEDCPEEYRQSEIKQLERDMVEVGREDCKRREEGKPIKERNVIRLEWIDSEDCPEEYRQSEIKQLERDMEQIKKDIQRWKNKGFPGRGWKKPEEVQELLLGQTISDAAILQPKSPRKSLWKEGERNLYPRSGLTNFDKLHTLNESQLERLHSELKTLEQAEQNLLQNKQIVVAIKRFVEEQPREGQRSPIREPVAQAFYNSLLSPANTEYKKALAATEQAYQRVSKSENPA